jgi:uncharacterized SAM-binding protein YcdF (DUF218 family)
MRLYSIFGTIALCFVLFLYSARTPILIALGGMLDESEPPIEADFIVVVRGDEVYFDRALTASELFKAGYSKRVYISSALDDIGAESLRKHGVRLPSAQDNIASTLLQRGVPCDAIAIDEAAPGGGTLGEMRRIKTFMTAQNLHSVVIVTSWFHSRRTGAIANDVLVKFGKRAAVVVANSDAGPGNWWTRRYVAIIVLEEFFKAVLYEVIGDLNFLDNPERSAAYRTEGHYHDACPEHIH